MSSILSYFNNSERWHEQGHVYGYAMATFLVGIFCQLWTPFIFIAPFLISIPSIILELFIEGGGWIKRWSVEVDNRFDLFYDLLTKAVYGPALGYLFLHSIFIGHRWWFGFIFAALIIVSPIKWRFFQNRK